MFGELPFEVIERVASFSNVTDLKALSCCCQALRDHLQPLLWQSVTLSIPQLCSLDSISSDETRSCFKYTNILSIGIQPHTKRYNRNFELDQKEKLNSQHATFFSICNPKILHSCFIPAGGFQNENGPLKRLQELHLYQNGIDNTSLKTLGNLGIESLSVTGSNVKFSHLEGLNFLSKLCITDCWRFENGSMAIVAKIVTLKVLEIRGCHRFGSLGLTNAKPLTNLESFSVHECAEFCEIFDLIISKLSGLVKLKKLDVLFSKELTDEGMRHLSNLINLEELHLTECTKITEVGIRYLLKIEGLKVLSVFGMEPFTDTAACLVSSMSKLEDLSVAAMLCGFQHLPQMVNLKNLCFNVYESDVVLPYVSRLEHLKSFCMVTEVITDIAYNHLVSMDSLEELTLQAPDMCDEMVFKISDLVKLKKLLLLGGTGITLVGVARISTSLKNLEYLGLPEACNVNSSCLVHIATMTSLRELNLNNCHNVSDEGLKYLGGMMNLCSLDISECFDVTDQGMKELCDIPNLEQLDVSGLYIGDDGLSSIAQCRKLRKLDISYCPVFTTRGVKHLRKLELLEEVDLSYCDGVRHDVEWYSDDEYDGEYASEWDILKNILNRCKIVLDTLK